MGRVGSTRALGPPDSTSVVPSPGGQAHPEADEEALPEEDACRDRRCRDWPRGPAPLGGGSAPQVRVDRAGIERFSQAAGGVETVALVEVMAAQAAVPASLSRELLVGNV